ncbi:MAG: DUF7657 domain-containing protein [Candidatus Saccharimonadaceae bacterium]
MTRVKRALTKFSKSIWFFPALLLVPVLILSVLQISGSSIGTYHQYFYGDTKADPDLIFNKPRSIRSDEWLVATQLSLAQDKDGFSAINKNIGNGIDISLLVDAPTTDFMQVFKPHNLGYFILPEGMAFALKWWLLSYLLIVSIYFFAITLLPKRKKVAVLLGLGFALSPFIFWWYQYITLAPIYYALFGIVVAIKMIHTTKTKSALLWGALLAYITTSFVLVLYPPFQIAVGLVALAFIVGYYLDHRKKTLKQNLPLVYGAITAVLLTVVLVGLSLVPKLGVIETINSTAYPGHRMTASGDFNASFFLANNTSILAQSTMRAQNYSWMPNQSEGSNFLLVFILLIPILVYFLIRYKRELPNFYTILATLIVSALYLVWMFVPNIDFLGSLTLLNRVPHLRLLIGFGLINVILAILTIQVMSYKQFKLPKKMPFYFSLGVLLFYLIIDLVIYKKFPQFMGMKLAILLALPYPVIIYLILTKRFTLGLVGLVIFSAMSVSFIHPLYRGVDVVEKSELSNAIRTIGANDSKVWVTDTLLLENFPVLNGKKSVSGVFIYPDNNLWSKSFPNEDEAKYNRYAHIHFTFDRSADNTISRSLTQPTPDQLIPNMEPCDSFLKINNVGYIITTQAFTKENASCATLVQKIPYPQNSVYIYRLSLQ